MRRIFLEDFSGYFLLRNEEKKSGDSNFVNKSGGSKIKICGKSALPETDPKLFDDF